MWHTDLPNPGLYNTSLLSIPHFFQWMQTYVMVAECNLKMILKNIMIQQEITYLSLVHWKPEAHNVLDSRNYI